MAPARRRPAARAPSKRASSASRAGARNASRASPSPSTTAWTVLSRLFAPTFSRRVARREDVERRRTRARALAVACVACVATYLREVYVPASVRDTFVDSLPDWVNDTVLARLPALELQPETRSRARGPGVELRERGLTPKHPVVIVPGFVSTGLELWRGKKCGAHFFRRRMWGTPAMARAFFSNQKCWMEHMRLDGRTGSDPESIRLRAVRGLEGVDWFVPGYFVWARVIEELSELGYDSNTLHSAAYDWRLSPMMLERRDGYFTRLKSVIETLYSVHGERVALLAHSYGDTISRYFFEWVETPAAKGGGGGGKRWVDKHVHAYVDIAGPMLGIPKTIPSLLSGEMRDTAILGELEGMLGGLLETAVGRLIGTQIKEVCDTFRTWGALWAMLPRGGAAVWGDHDAGAPESDALNFFLQMRAAGTSRETSVNHTVDSALGFLFEQLADSVPHNVAEFSATIDRASRERLKTRVPDMEAKTAPNFGDPLRSPLPRAPNMKVFCLYGVGKPTERAYVYERFDADALRPYQLDVQSRDGALTHGVWQVDGDGSIPLASLGYVCREWRVNRALNPANVSVVTREYAHRALPALRRRFPGQIRGRPRQHHGQRGHDSRRPHHRRRSRARRPRARRQRRRRARRDDSPPPRRRLPLVSPILLTSRRRRVATSPSFAVAVAIVPRARPIVARVARVAPRASRRARPRVLIAIPVRANSLESTSIARAPDRPRASTRSSPRDRVIRARATRRDGRATRREGREGRGEETARATGDGDATDARGDAIDTNAIRKIFERFERFADEPTRGRDDARTRERARATTTGGDDGARDRREPAVPVGRGRGTARGGREAVRAARREEDERKRGAEGERPIEGSDAVGECEAEREARRAETAETAHAAAGCG